MHLDSVDSLYENMSSTSINLKNSKNTDRVIRYEVPAVNGCRQRGGLCAGCGARKSKFVSTKGTGLRNKLINSLPVEMHLPSNNFTGPGLLPDVIPKSWSNRVDQAAYHHDLCYAKHKDTAARNSICDKAMLASPNAIPVPTMRTQVDQSIVKPLIDTKVQFGLGVKKEKEKARWSDQLADELH